MTANDTKLSAVSLDRDVITRAQNGDQQAVEQLFLQHIGTVHRFALRMCRDEERARDIAQESLLTALKSLPSFRAEASFSTWLFTIARSHCGKHRRRALRESVGIADNLNIADHVSHAPSPDTLAAHKQLSSVVDRALNSLDPGEREVILLRDVEGMSNQQAADSLQISQNALKSRLHRARTALRTAAHQLIGERPDQPNPRCPEVVEAFSRKLEGDLSDVDCSALQQHLQQCPECTRRCDSIRQILGACKMLRTESDPIEMKKIVRNVVASMPL